MSEPTMTTAAEMEAHLRPVMAALEARVAELEADREARAASHAKCVDEVDRLEAEVENLEADYNIERAEKAEAKLAEVEKLRQEKRHVEAAFDQLDGIKGRAEAAEAKVESLREQLQVVLKGAKHEARLREAAEAKLARVKEQWELAAKAQLERSEDAEAEVEKCYRWGRQVTLDWEADRNRLEAKLAEANERLERFENMNATFDIRPIPGEEYEGRQHGWRVYRDDFPFLDCSTGGTGPCWNVRESDDEGADRLHICDLDEMAQALVALRDSEAHRLNEERWS